MPQDTCVISVSFGNDEKTATIRFSRRSTPIVATILGVDSDSDGNPNTLYFDSLFHGQEECLIYSGWQPSGCVSTILTRVK